jgi:hypothetical protein
MNARAALTANHSTETFGLPACDEVLIAKLRNLPADFLASLRRTDEEQA